MNRLLTTALLLASLALGADLPETYQIILQRDVFNPRRVPAAPRENHATVAAPLPPTDHMTLLGVAVADGRATAVFSGSGPELSGARHPGETLGSGRIVTIDTDGVMFEADAVSTLQIRVGQTCTRTGQQPWQVSTLPTAPAVTPPPSPPPTAETPPQGASTVTAPAAPGAASPAGGAAPGDLLKQMLERRKRELAP